MCEPEVVTIKLNFSLPVPAPHSVEVTSNKAIPIRSIESNITLTCTVQLSQAVDVPVTVNIQMTDPDGQLLTTTSPAMNGFIYTTTVTIVLFGRSKSGDYTCTSYVTSSFINSPSKSSTLQLTLGESGIAVLYAHIHCCTIDLSEQKNLGYVRTCT